MDLGVLALQGDVIEHIKILRKAAPSAAVYEVKKTHEIDSLDGLIIPGGETTTLRWLMDKYGMDDAIREAEGLAIYGTCAGAILLATEVVNEEPCIGLVDMTIERNAYGRQVDSFEGEMAIPTLGDKPYPAVFIRAPIIRNIGNGVEVLAEHGGHPVLVRQGRVMAGTFHPELTRDRRLHEYFVGMAAGD